VYECMSVRVCVLCACVLVYVCEYTGMMWCPTRLKSAAVSKMTAGKMVARCVTNSNPMHITTPLQHTLQHTLQNGGSVLCLGFELGPKGLG